MTDELISVRLAQQEAQRHASGNSLGIEGMMAKISADVTAEANIKKDAAASFRRDITTFPAQEVIGAAIKHRDALKALTDRTVEISKAIHDMNVFLAEHGEN